MRSASPNNTTPKRRRFREQRADNRLQDVDWQQHRPNWCAHMDAPYDGRLPLPERLALELQDFVRTASPTRHELQDRTAVLEDVRCYVSRVWRDEDVRVLPFGSMATGLFLPSSDVDVVVVFDEGSRPAREAKWSAREHVIRLHEYIAERHNGRFDEYECILGAKVPLLKCRHVASGVEVDISFLHRDGLRSSDFLHEHVSRHQHLRPLILFMKHYLKQCDLHQPFYGGMGSYVLSLLAIFFVHYSRVQCPGELLLQFLEFFGELHDYRNDGLVVAEGSFFVKRMSRVQMFQNSVLSIRDPLGPRQDLGENIKEMSKIRALFSNSFRSLTRDSPVTPQQPTLLSRLVSRVRGRPIPQEELLEWSEVQSSLEAIRSPASTTTKQGAAIPPPPSLTPHHVRVPPWQQLHVTRHNNVSSSTEPV